MNGLPAAERPRQTTSFRAEWGGMRPALKRQDKGCLPNASTVIPHLHQFGIQTECPKRRAMSIQRVSFSMKVSTLLLWMQFSQAPDTGRDAALKQTRRCWLIKVTNVATAEEH